VPGQAGRPQDGRREFPPCAFCAHLTLTDWRRFRDGRDLDRFLDAHRNLIRGVAWRYTHGARVRLQDNEADRWRLRVDDDFVQVGSQALLYALGKYDPLRGVPFDAFVRPLIEKRVLSERRRMKRITSHEVAATEFEADPPRGMVRGQVHDENSWSLGGVSGHAGVFSTAPDMAVLAQALINGGTYGGHRILSQASVQTMTTDYNAAFPGHAHGLGFELDQSWFMDALSSPTTAGHTGYTGTSIVIDFRSGSFAILLSNRVHPSRNWGSSNPARCAAAQGLALAMGLPPRQDPIGLASGTGDAATTTLTTGALEALQPDEGGQPFCEHRALG